jgi:DNA-binding MarR family transcriptional regulator
MIENKKSEEQTKRFHRQIVDLIKKYQFRDRNRINCCGISVSQCYILEALSSHSPLTMNELADKMYLSISTVTRVVDQLVKKGLVLREEGTHDRRIRTINMTPEGKTVYKKSWENVFESEKTILNNFPEEHRELMIDFLKKLNHAVNQWQSCCSG